MIITEAQNCPSKSAVTKTSAVFPVFLRAHPHSSPHSPLLQLHPLPPTPCTLGAAVSIPPTSLLLYNLLSAICRLGKAHVGGFTERLWTENGRLSYTYQGSFIHNQENKLETFLWYNNRVGSERGLDKRVLSMATTDYLLSHSPLHRNHRAITLQNSSGALGRQRWAETVFLTLVVQGHFECQWLG